MAGDWWRDWWLLGLRQWCTWRVTRDWCVGSYGIGGGGAFAGAQHVTGLVTSASVVSLLFSASAASCEVARSGLAVGRKAVVWLCANGTGDRTFHPHMACQPGSGVHDVSRW